MVAVMTLLPTAFAVSEGSGLKATEATFGALELQVAALAVRRGPPARTLAAPMACVSPTAISMLEAAVFGSSQYNSTPVSGGPMICADVEAVLPPAAALMTTV